MASKTDIEKTKKCIAVVLDKMKNEADPQVLNEYRQVFKKEISLFNRSWAAAYLLMHFDQGRVQVQGNANFRSAITKTSETSRRQYPLAEEDSKRIFISIGRNRRVFPREILGLIIAKAGVARDDIGAIRILENYSFVQVRDTIAEQIIETLNGFIFRGRTLTVKYAKTRKDGPESQETTDADTDVDTDDSFEEEDDYSESDDADTNENADEDADENANEDNL